MRADGAATSAVSQPGKRVSDGFAIRGGVPIHIDAASAAFYPECERAFRMMWGTSINALGHKFGLVRPLH